ncbi:hypothetical protein DER44DRAFT_800510 [Fusarium oxysporum]|nr:hypothetical protein DER44DRAFT_800510 [Fusarium oxysporum]
MENQRPLFRTCQFLDNGQNWQNWRASDPRNEGRTRLQLRIGHGTGQQRWPFSVSRHTLNDTLSDFQFCYDIARRYCEGTSFFEHHFCGSDGSRLNCTPTHLEIAMCTYKAGAFLLYLRYPLGTETSEAACGILFSGHLESDSNRVIKKLQESYQLLVNHPILITNVMLQLFQTSTQDFADWVKTLNDVEASLGVSQDVGMLLDSGYHEVSWDFDALIAEVATLSKQAAESELTVTTTLTLAKALQSTVEVCENLEGRRQGWSEQRQEIQSTITRAEMTLHGLKMSQAVLDSLSTALYNRITQTETKSMKTIAVVTLLFLPATFVSAIFSTGIFDFHANESDLDKQVISSYGWIYLLACILTTGIALVVWVLWYKWGYIWMDKRRRLNCKEQ